MIPNFLRYYIWISFYNRTLTIQIHHHYMEKFYREYTLKF